MNKKIRILIAEDSKVVTELLRSILDAEPDFEVIACVDNGNDAVKMTKKLKPDLVTMDIHMPIMNGVEATYIIMSEFPTPIVVISAHVNPEEMHNAFDALKAGALTVIEKPNDVLHAGFESTKRTLLNTLRALSEVRVTRRRKIHKKPTLEKVIYSKSAHKVEIAGLGTSTGGPEALYFVLANLKSDIAVPIVIVQHITDGFLPGLISWLECKSNLPIHIAEDQQLLKKGHVYFAPNNFHLTIKHSLSGPIAILDDSAAVAGFKPSATKLFLSIAAAYPQNAIAGLLTGMGSDGAEGLLEIKKSGSHTFIQNESSSIVFGMPGSAKKMEAECDVVDLIHIPAFLNNFLIKGETK